MAKNMSNSGVKVIGYDRNSETRLAAKIEGIEETKNPIDLVL